MQGAPVLPFQLVHFQGEVAEEATENNMYTFRMLGHLDHFLAADYGTAVHLSASQLVLAQCGVLRVGVARYHNARILLMPVRPQLLLPQEVLDGVYA